MRKAAVGNYYPECERLPGLGDAFFTPLAWWASNRSEISYFPFGVRVLGNSRLVVIAENLEKTSE